MSLINDALKNAAKASAPGEPGDSRNPAAPMRAAEAHPSAGLPRYFFPVLLCIFCGAIWFLSRGWDAHRGTDSGAGQTLSVQARETDRGVGSPSSEGLLLTASSEGALFPLPDENAPIPNHRNFALNEAGDSNAGNGAGTPVATSPRLQGIFIRASGPSAMIDSETVFVGDAVAGSRVKAIDRTSVTLERDGQTQVLNLRR